MSDEKKARKAEEKARKKEAKAALKRAKAEAERAVEQRPAPGGEEQNSRPGSSVRRVLGQGVFQLVIKIVAGLIVAYVLIRLGMR